MRRIILCLLTLFVFYLSHAQEKQWGGKFEQLDTELPTPNEYRSGSGAPGHAYWQQKADYDIEVELDDKTQSITGKEKVTYYNNSPDNLKYLWVQLDQNVREQETNTLKVQQFAIQDSLPAKFAAQGLGITDYDGGFKIKSVTDANGKSLPYTINKTMMRIDLPQPLKSRESTSFGIEWRYNINDRMDLGGRSGLEYFPKDDNYLYTIAQFHPRMAVYDDYEGWQNKQFLGRGEFALTFGDFKVKITVPSDHIVASTGTLQNPKDVLTKEQQERLERAKKSFDKPVIIATQAEAIEREKKKSDKKSTWVFHAENVRDFAFASSRKFIWDAQAVKIGNKTPLAMSYYPKEGNPLWEQESTKAVKNTLETYSKYTIEYPYPVAISVHAASIGMEYPMICFNFGRPNEDGTYSDRTKYRMIGVIIHEVGHNFFPMIINSDERQWTWMDEGLNTFVQYRTEQEQYDNFPSRRGPAADIVDYMKGDKKYIRPIMTNSEQIMQFGNNAYAKPATALNILRETVMGPELFDAAFKEYAQRWAFKHPAPADFFRTMEDASAVDLDWFWRGWFYTTDHVDIAVDEVKWFTLRTEQSSVESKGKRVKKGDLSAKDGDKKAMDFSQGPEEFSLVETDPRYYGEFMNRVDDKAIMQKFEGKNLYQVRFKNEGGLVMPVIVEFTFKDGTKTTEKIPAEIWRYNEEEATKVFVFDKEVTNIVLDPKLETADTDVENNIFPRQEVPSEFDQFKDKKGK
ncbi:Zn-dependent aminopeptidase [Fulvivirga imtechensis AK7]|uniref:Zn-dependent aminopeptidase n=1 Tax=Fulvivirga imtechensis AK7 TaxID=1237149 RepID=L8JH20_9BACT|nr:M1 family metallopeptidase [Fulvivirga imtechensis]ELR68125.1 Zn-dependent aminopeptidase [Fulvivirga imtechensis AK7]